MVIEEEEEEDAVVDEANVGLRLQQTAAQAETNFSASPNPVSLHVDTSNILAPVKTTGDMI